ncbi:DsrE family protein [Croceivirga radicis]|uniref:DsrE family protein n=1 Tax=Croceivirga radicis TaxID=1929488 RepID=UPI0004959CD1|nr:DsrE family protein [Croceivirga radicis]
MNFLLFFMGLSVITSYAQEKTTGPIIENYGAVWAVENADYKVDKTLALKVVFDIMGSPEDPSALNRSIETAARFLNMHAQAGVPKEDLKVALVVHNAASKDVMDNPFYEKKYGTKNPNKELLAALKDNQVQIIFCGQSSNSRNIPKEQLIDGVQLSLSAMTALIQLQDQGYRLVKF